MAPSAAGEAPALISSEKPVARVDARIGSTIRMPKFARRAPTMSSFVPVDIFHRILWLYSKDYKYRSFNLINSPTPSTFSCWKIRYKTQVSSWSDFPTEAMFWTEEVEMVDPVDELKSSRSILGKDFPNFETLDARIASVLNKIIQNSYFKKKLSLEEPKAQKEDWFLRRRHIAFMTYDYFRVTGAHDTVLDFADLFSINLRNDNVQEFDTRWDEILLSMTKISWKVCTN